LSFSPLALVLEWQKNGGTTKVLSIKAAKLDWKK
jgi:hypothetical protein